MALLIEQMTKEASVQNQDAGMEKAASDLRTLDQSRAMVSIGSTLYKVAEEGSFLSLLGQDTYRLGANIGECLSKTAQEGTGALEEAAFIAGEIYKLASVFEEIRTEYPNDQDFAKMAGVVIDIANEMQEELSQL